MDERQRNEEYDDQPYRCAFCAKPYNPLIGLRYLGPPLLIATAVGKMRAQGWSLGRIQSLVQHYWDSCDN